MITSNTLLAAFERRFGIAYEGELAVLDEAALLRMANRRSIRRFRSDPIPQALLDSVLLATQSAPAKSDLQQYSIIIVRDHDRRQQLAAIAGGDPWIGTAPVILVFLGDLHRIRRVCSMHGRAYVNDNLDSFMNAAVDAGIALASCVNAAESQGLGCCPLSIIRNNIEAASAMLELPDCVFPLAALGIGFADEEPLVSMRLPPAVVVHEERYDDSALQHEMSNYDDRRREREPIPDRKQRHPDKFGFDRRITWSANAARQMAVPERAGFRGFLNKRGLNID